MVDGRYYASDTVNGLSLELTAERTGAPVKLTEPTGSSSYTSATAAARRSVWEENYDGTLFQPTASALMDLPDTVAAENLADYHLHVYVYLMEGCFRMKLFYTRPNHRPKSVERMAALLTETMRGMLLQR